MAQIRRAVWRDGADDGWHDDVVWYAAGMHRMRALTPRLDEFLATFSVALERRFPDGPLRQLRMIAQTWSDPMSLGYQSQVHGTFVARRSWPRHRRRQALWQECAHNHWFFLPWHRAYLLEFEAVVREHIRQLGGPADDWALPYWNYSDFRSGRERLGLPLPLRGATLPDGVEVPGVTAGPDGRHANPLFDPTRLGAADAAPGESPAWASAALALLRPHYANQEDSGRVSFGGGVLEDPANAALFHDSAAELGQLDLQPHGSVHVRISGAMGMFQTAALDPVFWLHHCNIDRLWETYAHDLGHGYPFQDGSGVGTPAHRSWTTRQFRFLRPDGSIRTWTAPGVLEVGALGYAYDTTEPPALPAVPPLPPPGSAASPFGIAAGHPAEPVAEAGPVTVAGRQDIPVTAGAGAPADVTVDSFPADASWLLRFDGIRSARPVPTSFHVFLGLAPDEAADPEDGRAYAGLLSLFGVFEASRDDGTSDGSGSRRRLDVTAQVRSQVATLRPLDALVRLVPADPDRDLAGAALVVERITLELA